MAAKCEVEHDWQRCWRDSCEKAQGCAELARCEPFKKRPPTPVGWSDTDWIRHLQEQDDQHPLSGLHINQGSLDAAADAYEAEYNKAHGIETPNAKVSGAGTASAGLTG